MNESKVKTTYTIIVITALFSVVISMLMLFNYLQLANNDPIESEAMTALIERLSDDPNNETLKAEIRAFDLMARKAYFTSQWQIQTGGWLLLAGAVILILALRYYFKITSKIEAPNDQPVPQQTRRLLSSKWLLGTGALLLVLAIVASFASVDHLKHYEAPLTVADNLDEEIELVDLTENEVVEEASEAIVGTANAEANEYKANQPEEKQAESSSQTTTPKEEITRPAPKATNTYPSTETLKKQYNSFRGYLGQGVSEAGNTPTTWDVATGNNILWKTKIPLHGYSSPVIWNKKLFVTGANASERWVYCYHADSGELIWQQQANNIEGSPATAPKTTDDTGLAAPSVVCDGKTVVAIFGTGDIIAFDMDGNRKWARNLGVPDNHYGHSSSLLSWKEKVFVQYDTNKGGRLLALNIESGEIMWETKRNSHISWASPILIEVGDQMQIVTSSEPCVAGYDINSGKELWNIECMMGEVGPSPGFGNGLVFAANEYATLAAIDPAKGEMVWEDNYYLPEVASPVVADGLLFIGTSYGVLACFDVHSHNMYWEAEFNNGFYSSPIVADGKLYATDMDGVVHILKIDREKQLIASVELGERCTTTPAFTDGRMYIRGSENLFCITSP